MVANQDSPHADSPDNGSPADVIVIGGGAVGCFAAYYLQRRGARVTIVERDMIGSGASSGNCGYLCPGHVMPLCGPGAIREALPMLLRRGGALSVPLRYDPSLWKWLAQFSRKCSASHRETASLARHALLKRSDELMREFLTDCDFDCLWQKRGLLVVHRSDRTMDHFATTAERLRSDFDIAMRRLGPQDLQSLEPNLVDGLAGGWLFENDSHVHPGMLMQGLKASLLNAGVRILESTEVTQIVRQDGRICGLETSAGKLQASQYLLATGAESPRLASSLGVRLPIVPGKGYSMDFPMENIRTSDQGSAVAPPTVPIIFEDSHVAITPLGDRLRVGSTMQLTGYDRTIDANRVAMIRDDAQSYLRCDLPASATTVWAGWRPMSADGIPSIDRSLVASNVYVASGNGMIGLSTAAASGELVTHLMLGDNPIIDPTPYSIQRFCRDQRVRSLGSTRNAC